MDIWLAVRFKHDSIIFCDVPLNDNIDTHIIMSFAMYTYNTTLIIYSALITNKTTSNLQQKRTHAETQQTEPTRHCNIMIQNQQKQIKYL